MQQSQTLRTESWVASGTRIIPLNLSPGKRCRALHVYGTFSGTGTNGETAATADNVPLAYQRFQLGEYVNIAGESLLEVNKDLLGSLPPAETETIGGGVFSATAIGLQIPFRDPRQSASDDGSIPCELLSANPGSLSITFAAATIWGGTNTTITAGTIYVQADLIEETAVPQINRLYDVQPGSLTFTLEPGVYKLMFLLDGGAGVNGSITRAEVTTVDMVADGTQVWSSTRHEQLVTMCAQQTLTDAAGTTASTGLSVNATSRLPLVWHDRYGKSHLTKQVAIEKTGTVRIASGSITAGTMTVVIWRAVPKSDAAIDAIAVAVGESKDAPGFEYKPATASKAPLGSFARSLATGRPTRKARIAGLTLAGHFRPRA